MRKDQFRKRFGKFQHLRKMGVNTAIMAQAAAATSMLYGTDCCGVSNTMLDDVRRTAAKICVGSAGGKSAIKSLYAVDGAVGVADPAFLAHLNPIVAWANAWWDNWTSADNLEAAFAGTKPLIDNAKNRWAMVKGPVGATIASATRLGWSFISPSVLKDDRGAKWNLQLDPPAAIKKAVKQSARRWRLSQIAAETTGLFPKDNDITKTHWKDEVIIDCTATGLTALNRKTSAHRDAPNWCRKFKPEMTSAVAGGQWPQTRKASVPQWNITDRNCQLCHKASGTIEHRFECERTRQSEGWADIPSELKEKVKALGEDRSRTLKTKGLVCV